MFEGHNDNFKRLLDRVCEENGLSDETRHDIFLAAAGIRQDVASNVLQIFQGMLGNAPEYEAFQQRVGAEYSIPAFFEKEPVCEMCGGTRWIPEMAPVYPGEPHLADIGGRECPNHKRD